MNIRVKNVYMATNSKPTTAQRSQCEAGWSYPRYYHLNHCLSATCLEGSGVEGSPQECPPSNGQARRECLCGCSWFVLFCFFLIKEHDCVTLFSPLVPPERSQRPFPARRVKAAPRPRSRPGRLQHPARLFGSFSSYSPQAAWASKTRSFHLGGAYWQPAVWFPRKQNLG